MTKTKALIFDYGGTLDSRGEHWSHIIRRGYSAARLEPDDEQFRDAYVHGERTLATNRLILPHHNFLQLMDIKAGVELDLLVGRGVISAEQAAKARPVIAAYCDSHARECTRESAVTLAALAAAGVPMVLVSNFYGNIGAVLTGYGLDGYFGSVVESAVVGVRKPDPRIFALGVEALGLSPEEVTVVGDSYSKDILPARSLGCRALWLRGRGWESGETGREDPDSMTSVAQVLDAAL